MSEPINEPTNNQPPVADVNEPQSGNPAWNDFLEVLPTSLHGQVTPVLEKWDQNVQQLVGKVHSEYEPWKPFIEQKIEPEALNEAYAVYSALQDNPQATIEAIQKFYGISSEQGQPLEVPTSNEDPDPDALGFDLQKDPEFLRVKNMAETMAQAEIARAQQAEADEWNKKVSDELAELHKTYGAFDEDYVLNKAAATGGDLAGAAKAYSEMIQAAVAASRNPTASAPIVMGGGGGTQTSQVAVSQLDAAGRKKLVVDMLRNAQANANGG